MQRITHVTAKNNRFIQGTIITDQWLNSVQEELAHVIESENIKLSYSSNQLLNLAIDNKIHNATNTEPIKNIIADFSSEAKEVATKINNYVDKNNDILISFINTEIKQKLNSLKNENSNLSSSLENRLNEIKNLLNKIASDMKKIEDIRKEYPKEAEIKSIITKLKTIVDRK